MDDVPPEEKRGPITFDWELELLCKHWQSFNWMEHLHSRKVSIIKVPFLLLLLPFPVTQPRGGGRGYYGDMAVKSPFKGAALVISDF